MSVVPSPTLVCGVLGVLDFDFKCELLGACCSDYCLRIGSQWIGFPAWQRGASQEKDKIVLSKTEKKVAGLLRDLLKRKGGTFFEFAVDPSTKDSGGLDEYFAKVPTSSYFNAAMLVFLGTQSDARSRWHRCRIQ